MRSLLLVFLTIQLPGALLAQDGGSTEDWTPAEVNLYANDGRPTAYIWTDNGDMTIYTWDGYAVAWLEPDCTHGVCVYGFNGRFLGWYADGLIYDRNGQAAGYTEGARQAWQIQHVPPKGTRRFRPVPDVKEWEPYAEYWYPEVASPMHLELLLRSGAKP